MAHAFYAIGLNLHQPYGNLLELHNSPNAWEAKQILLAYERPPRYVREGGNEARLHLALSGTLLMQLTDPGITETFQYTLDLRWLLDQFRASRIEFLGSGYTHPVFPLIPQSDWDAQLGRYQELARPALGRSWFPGFWAPEMGFSMEMIPYLKKFGYRYVVVDVEHLEPLEPMRWEKLRYRPHLAQEVAGGVGALVEPGHPVVSPEEVAARLGLQDEPPGPRELFQRLGSRRLFGLPLKLPPLAADLDDLGHAFLLILASVPLREVHSARRSHVPGASLHVGRLARRMLLQELGELDRPDRSSGANLLHERCPRGAGRLRSLAGR